MEGFPENLRNGEVPVSLAGAVNPKITVCIPSYNCARFLPAAIDSVLGQTCTDLELIIVDDCSTDDSRAIIARYAAQDNRISAVFNEANRGMVPNWNFCLSLCRGEYVRFLFADDLLATPDTLERMAGVLDDDRTVSLVASARHFIDADGAVIKTESRFSGGTIAAGTAVVNRCLREGRNLIGEPSVVMFRHSQALRGFNPAYRQLVDLEMWFHLLEQGRFVYLGEPLTSFRIHTDQQTRKNVRDLAHIDDMFLLLDDYIDRVYIRWGRVARWFVRYNQSYRLWKLYRQGLLDQAAASQKIAEHCDLGRFRRLLPVYKVYSPWFKVRNLLAAHRERIA